MPAQIQEMPNEKSGFVSDLAGVPSFFIDPEGAAKRVHSKWFWVIALVIASIVAVAVSFVTMPIALHAASVSPPPDGVTTEQMVSRTEIGLKVVRYASPIITAIFWLLEAAIMLGIATIMGVEARFGALFNLVAGCGLIQSLAAIAAGLILHFKGEVSSMAELRPAMGLDIFMPEGTNKFLGGVRIYDLDFSNLVGGHAGLGLCGCVQGQQGQGLCRGGTVVADRVAV